MLPKDLLNLVFWELEDGHDIINFSEISRRCHQIFHQNLEVVKKIDLYGDPKIFTRQKRTQQKHGLYRVWWNNGQLYVERNFIHDQNHGLHQSFLFGGFLSVEYYYYHGKQI